MKADNLKNILQQSAMRTLTVLTCALLTVFFACQGDSESVRPEIGPISESVYASGVVKSKNQYHVYAAANGLIQDILVNEGDRIEEGEELMRLVNDPARLNASNARLAADHASFQNNKDKLREFRLAIDLAAGALRNDSLLAARQRALWSQNIGKLVELEQRELAYQNAAMRLEIARIQYHDLKRQLDFMSKQSQNNLEISSALANDYVIRSEADGRVYKILKEKGEFVGPLNPVAIVGDADSFYVELTVDEYDIARVRTGQRVLITMDSYKGELFEASVSQIAPLMNEQSRSFTIHADFVLRPALLYPNLSLEANIIIQSRENAMTIPRSYLIGDSAVMVSNGEVRKVVTGLMDYHRAEITGGLNEEDILLLPGP